MRLVRFLGFSNGSRTEDASTLCFFFFLRGLLDWAVILAPCGLEVEMVAIGVTDIRIVYVFVLSYTSYFHIVEVKYG